MRDSQQPPQSAERREPLLAYYYMEHLTILAYQWERTSTDRVEKRAFNLQLTPGDAENINNVISDIELPTIEQGKQYEIRGMVLLSPGPEAAAGHFVSICAKINEAGVAAIGFVDSQHAVGTPSEDEANLVVAFKRKLEANGCTFAGRQAEENVTVENYEDHADDYRGPHALIQVDITGRPELNPRHCGPYTWANGNGFFEGLGDRPNPGPLALREEQLATMIASGASVRDISFSPALYDAVLRSDSSQLDRSPEIEALIKRERGMGPDEELSEAHFNETAREIVGEVQTLKRARDGLQISLRQVRGELSQEDFGAYLGAGFSIDGLQNVSENVRNSNDVIHRHIANLPRHYLDQVLLEFGIDSRALERRLPRIAETIQEVEQAMADDAAMAARLQAEEGYGVRARDAAQEAADEALARRLQQEEGGVSASLPASAPPAQARARSPAPAEASVAPSPAPSAARARSPAPYSSGRRVRFNPTVDTNASAPPPDRVDINRRIARLIYGPDSSVARIRGLHLFDRQTYSPNDDVINDILMAVPKDQLVPKLCGYFALLSQQTQGMQNQNDIMEEAAVKIIGKVLPPQHQTRISHIAKSAGLAVVLAGAVAAPFSTPLMVACVAMIFVPRIATHLNKAMRGVPAQEQQDRLRDFASNMIGQMRQFDEYTNESRNVTPALASAFTVGAQTVFTGMDKAEVKREILSVNVNAPAQKQIEDAVSRVAPNTAYAALNALLGTNLGGKSVGRG